MKKILLSIFSLLLCCIVLPAQDISGYFISMPDTLLPQLENEWRKDLVDLAKSGKEARLKNIMDGTSTLKELTTDYLFLEISGKSSLEMKLLPLVNNTHILCVIRTVNGPVADSRVTFYTTGWQELEAEALYTPVNRDTFLKDSGNVTDDNFLFAVRRLDMDLIKYSLSSQNNTLTATYMTPEYLSVSERNEVLPYLTDEPKIFNWRHSRFE